jgi:hypothetical protein
MGWLDDFDDESKKNTAVNPEAEVKADNPLNEDQKFLLEMANSPLFKKRFAKMMGQPLENPIPFKQEESTSYNVPFSADAFRKSIIDNINTVKYAPVGVGDFSAGSDGLTAGAYYLPKESSAFNEKLLALSKFSKQALESTKSVIANQHTIFTNNDPGPYTKTHETSHASTLGRLNLINPYIAKFKSPESYNKEWATWAKEQYDNENFRKYISDPSEIKARVDASRKALMDGGKYNPIKNEFGEKEYNLLLQSDEKNSLDLINNFPKEEVIRMFNEIVTSKPKKNPDSAQSAESNWLDEIS